MFYGRPVAPTELGPWEPLSLADTIETFARATFSWWISGGRALELHLGRSWRDHEDTDVGLSPRDAPRLRTVLDGWDIYVAAAGRLEPWNGHEPRADRHENNLWCRSDPTRPWSLDVTIGEGDGDAWVYRRDPRLRVPRDEAVLWSAENVPYFAPELQLLFKSKDIRPKDDLDAAQVIPALATGRRRRLARLLPADHSWQRIVSAAS